MRRWLPIILLIPLLATPLSLHLIYGTGSSSVGSKNGPRLVIVSSHFEGIRREFAQAFSDWHERHYGQAVLVDYRNYGGTSDMVRYFRSAEQTIYNRMGTYQVDLVWGGGDTVFESQLKTFSDGSIRRPGCLEPITLSDQTMRFAFPQPTLNGIALYDVKDNAWFGTAFTVFGICYNKDICRYLGTGEPKTWKDLVDPRWINWLILSDPTRSGSFKTTFMIIVERAMIDAEAQGRGIDRGWAEGMGLIRLIASNAKMFTDSAAAVPGIIASGDGGAGMAIDFYGKAEVEAVGDARMGYVEPLGATALNADPIGLVRGAEHRETAIRFIEFVLGPEGQKLWNTRAGAASGPKSTSLRRLPIAPDAYADMSNATGKVDPFASPLGFPTSDSRRKTFGIIAELVQMSCIDLLDELRDTRTAIVQAGRADLEARLGTFPFDQPEAIRRASVWSQATPLQRVELQRQWTAEFRNEYRLLRAEALPISPTAKAIDK